MGDAAWAGYRVLTGHSPISDMPTRAPLSDLAFFLFACVGLVAGLRRLPIAYTGYTLAGLLFILVARPSTAAGSISSVRPGTSRCCSRS